MLFATTLLPLLAIGVLGCADHGNSHSHPHRGKRQITVNPGRVVTDWAYEASYDWGRLQPAYELCQTGTQQSPIPLGLNQGLAKRHTLDFTGYDSNVTGNFYNWGYGPAFTLHHEQHVYNTLPSMKFNNETVYLTGWHIHSPGDHTVGADRSKAELHYVHTNAEGNYRAVIAIRLDPGDHESPFFAQLPTMIGFNDTTQIEGTTINPLLALDEVTMVNEFWTYKGSLTSPPCKEGVQWFVARTILFVSDIQMQNILRVSTYSARQEQEVWLHEINV